MDDKPLEIESFVDFPCELVADEMASEALPHLRDRLAALGLHWPLMVIFGAGARGGWIYEWGVADEKPTARQLCGDVRFPVKEFKRGDGALKVVCDLRVVHDRGRQKFTVRWTITHRRVQTVPKSPIN